MEKRVMTAPLAIIRINSVVVGKMKGLRLTESIRRGRVTGLGTLVPSEIPAIEWSGSLTCDSYTINFNRLANVERKGTFRNTTSIEEWQNALLLQEDGLEISIQRKAKDGEIDPETGMVKAKYETFALVKGAFATREGFDIQEGQISGRNTEFEYINPVLFDNVAE